MSKLGQKGEFREWKTGGVLARLMGDAVWGGRLVVCPRVSKKRPLAGEGAWKRRSSRRSQASLQA